MGHGLLSEGVLLINLNFQINILKKKNLGNKKKFRDKKNFQTLQYPQYLLA